MMRFVWAFAFVVLAACGSRAPEPAGDGQDVSVTSSNFTDADPTDWQGRAPETYPVHGIDLSRFQTSVDWPTARANGVNFAFVKATEGGDLVDPMFQDHWRGAGAAGVKRGAYHFFYHCRPAAEQARWYIAHVPRTAGALPPVLDMEWTPTSPTCTLRREAATIRAEAGVFIAAVTAHYGRRPILYTSVDFFEDNEMWRVAGAEFWLRSVAAHPRDVYDSQRWSFWQYTSTGQVPGIVGRVDINVFAGSRAGWTDWLEVRAQ